MCPEDSDTPIEPEAQDTPEASGESMEPFQSEVDKLMAARPSAGETEEAPKSEDDPQDVLEALLSSDAPTASVSQTEEAKPVEEEGALSNEDLEAFLEAAPEELVSITEDSPEAGLLANAVEEHEATAAGASEEAATQADLEALLSATESTSLDGNEDDAPLVEEQETISESSENAKVAEPAPVTAEVKAEPEEKGESVSQDLLDSLISASNATTEEIGSENLAAAATTPSISESDDVDLEIPTKVVRSDEAPELDESAFETIKVVNTKQQAGLRMAASLVAGILVTASSFWYMMQNLSYTPGWDELATPGVLTLELAMEKAEQLIDLRDYALAISTLEAPLEEAPGGPTKSDAAFLLLEARYLNFNDSPSLDTVDALHGSITETIKEHGDHARVPDALYWQAKLYRWENLPGAALAAYESIIENYSTLPQLDRVFYEATEVAMESRDPRKAAKLAQQLQAEHPGSTYSSAARLLLGDAYAMAGMEEESRTLYRRVADNERLGSDRSAAILRLGKHAYAAGAYEDAIRDLDSYLNLTTETEGIEEIYLLLARSYRGAERLVEARDTMQGLLNFFELDDSFAPEAMVEYSQILDILGDHKEALTIAQQITARYPENPMGHRHRGMLLGLSGNPYGAAVSLLEANTRGAEDPKLVLLAARHLRTTGLYDEAISTYQLLQREYSGSHASIEGGIEEAALLYQQGAIMKSIKKLEELTAFTETSEHYIPALVTLANIYKDMDFMDELSTTAKKIAERGSQASDLAVAALALFQTGELDTALEIADRVPLGQLGDKAAYDLLLNQGKALTRLNPERSLETLEDAYLSYPTSRTLDGDITLLDGYLKAERTTAARRMVMELSIAAQETPADMPYYIDAAIGWGDYLFGREDYRAAAEAYKQAQDASESGHVPITGIRKDLGWAQYQRANALLALSDFSGSLALFDEIAASDAAWAQEASMKAEYVRLEQQLRNRKVARN